MLEEAPRSDIKTSRRFRRRVAGGMRVSRSMTVNFDLLQIIEHVEIECPNHKLTNNGPVFEYKQTEIEDVA